MSLSGIVVLKILVFVPPVFFNRKGGSGGIVLINLWGPVNFEMEWTDEEYDIFVRKWKIK